MNHDFRSFILLQIWNVPFLLLNVVGIVFALTRWPRHPPVSLLALIAFLIFLLCLLTGAGVQFWQLGASEHGYSPLDIGRVSGIMAVVQVILRTIAWVLLMIAIFGWRTGQPAQQIPKV